ncbi:SRPBCC family protein [Mucilaginibacter arboris]|uniref:Polyketide cyclase n=1 Tax=Mucilaginibacter arboris TaxID=2682090 RepID=A0A7K1T1E4_9SPHI|nr:SRPBCC family protein [Mucilaginibacter arboris]MVN23374.1 polyketide cyclase [Mucilaginibacter arboris]
MTTNSVTLHRVLKAKPEKVFRAFAEPNALAAWIPPYGFLCTVHEMDFLIEGSYKMSFTNFSTGNSHSFGGKFLEIRQNKFIKHTDIFDDPNLPGEMITSVWLTKVICGTELKVVQEGIPSAIPTEMCYLGWQESLDKLMRLVEPEIADAPTS